MTHSAARYYTGRSVSVFALLIAVVVIAACFINPAGVYKPWGLTFGIGLFLAIVSALSAIYFQGRLSSLEDAYKR